MMMWHVRTPVADGLAVNFLRANVFCAASATLFQSLTHAEAHS